LSFSFNKFATTIILSLLASLGSTAILSISIIITLNPNSNTRFFLIVIGIPPILGKIDTELLLVDCDDLDIELGGILVTVFVTNRRNGVNTEWTEFTVALSISSEGLF
jgi:hypothetical protein